MATVQMDAELLRNLSIIAEDETKLEKVAKYIRKIAKQLTDDPTRMSKEEFFARIDEAEKQIENGEYTVQLQGESVADMLRRGGYAL